VAQRRETVVGRVGVDPSDARAEEGRPGVRGIRPPELRQTRGRVGLGVAAHVARPQSDRAEAGDQANT
jgi:hypothetical protein